MRNKIYDLLINLGISDSNSFEKYSQKVRDKDDIYALKCNKSGVIILNTTEHIEKSYYENKNELSYWNTENLKQARNKCYEDDLRRSELIKNIIINKKWLDFGTGAGGILEILSGVALDTCGVEIQKQVRDLLNAEGFKVYDNLEDISEDKFDVITMFHVLEHIPDPILLLKSLKQKMIDGGKIIIEVPHANDFLLSFLNNENFKEFTLWSEHLILHTRTSLNLVLRESGFKNISIKGIQRYPLSNHLHWLTEGKPGGHVKWSNLNSEEIINAYSNLLASLDKTDTLLAFAEK